MTLLVDPIDLHRELKQRNIEISSFGPSGSLDPEEPGIAQDIVMDNPIPGETSPINLGFLRFAAKKYHISPDIRDYLLVPQVIVPIGYPNRNGMGYALEDLVEWSVEHGMQYYKTWTGKPTYYEHQNQEPEKANGLILDVFLRKANRGRYWKMLNYLAFDRSKYSDLIRRVANKEITSCSMGAHITGGYTCSVCDRQLGNCTHVTKGDNRIRQVEIAGVTHLGYRVGRKPVGFETSLVETPAWSIANNDNVTLVDPTAEYI